VDEGEKLELAAVREAREETGLEVSLVEQFHAYSDPRRDPRKHTISTVFIGRAEGVPQGGDDAARAEAFSWTALPQGLVFDHNQILADVRRYLLTGVRRRL
jgi:8-oxo-dGTP diphosphatase